jgi:glycosyltransferase involved in cell wall biosynthesis
LLVVEGNLGGGYDWGLKVAVELANSLAASQDIPIRPLELVVAGGAAAHIQQAWQARCRVPLHFTDWLPRIKIPALDRSAHLLYAADIHPACPNSVIEALACGLPVLAFDTGALNELVTSQAGRLVPYGGDAWQLAPPDIPGLVRAAGEILVDQNNLRRGARQHAEKLFDLDKMVEAYVNVLLG